MSYVTNRYAKAITSSNLKVETKKAGDADVLIATGWAGNPLRSTERLRSNAPGVSLASLLQRLRIEYDRIDRKSLSSGPVDNAALTLAYSHLRCLNPTRTALLKYVTSKASREHLELSPRQLARLCDLLLEHFLDPTCSACKGVAYEAVIGTGRLSNIVCPVCAGTGRKVLKWSVAGEDFIKQVQDDLSKKLQALDHLRGKFLK